MSDADIKANIGVSTDVEQATKRTNNSIVSMGKQIEDVQKKFSTAGKDLFLGFFAPMAIFQTLVGFIQENLAKAKQDAKDGLELLAKGETVYATSEQKKMANFFKAKNEREAEQESVKKGLTEITRQFLQGEEGKKVYLQFLKEMGPIKFNEEEAKKQDFTISNPRLQKLALDAFLASPEGKTYAPIFGDKNKDFKGPEGFSNVIGVGANPTLDAMTKQNELTQAMLDELRFLTEDKKTATDFTKKNQSATSGY